jgi:hypothetical protein
MSDSPAQTVKSGSRSSKQEPSYGHLLLVWFLVGFSLMGLGLDLHQATPVTIPVSSLNAGLLFGTVVVVSLWIAGFRPSLGASAIYFTTQLIVHLVLALILALTLPGSTSEPWVDVGLRVLSIILAATLGFTTVGRRGRDRLRQQGQRLVQSLMAN